MLTKTQQLCNIFQFILSGNWVMALMYAILVSIYINWKPKKK